MLERLRIRDLALVERADVDLGPGLNVVTGETGTGKSLLVQSVDLLVGGKASADAVRDGAKSAIVEGEFRLEGDSAARVATLLEAWGHGFDGETLIVRRELQATGRSRASVNQSPVTLAALRQLGETLADLHGQHEHQRLLRPGAALDVLDALGALAPQRDGFRDALAEWKRSASALNDLEESLAHFSERRDYLATASAELDDASLREGEEDALRADADRLRHADRLRELVTEAASRLSEADGSAVDDLHAAFHSLDQAAALDASLADLLPAIEEARIAAQEAARTLSSYVSDLEADPDALEAIETRRELIMRLTRKYRRDVPGLIAWHQDIARELATGEDGESALARARDETARAHEACLAAGRTLSRRRRAAAGEWTAKLSRELKPLGFARARIAFDVTSPDALAAEPPASGLDEVMLRFSANPGEAPRPLHRVASGGELSRIMLALKTALEAQDPVDLLLFDEVDSGIGGAVAQAVGERLRRLSRHRQLVCVTHLPMIAALASHHVRVSKRTTGGRTVARFETVHDDTRIEEISRMLAGGRVTETTRRQARELLGDFLLKPAAR